jgi:hypothetical protein
MSGDDLVIVDLATENADLIRLVALGETYREMAKQAIEQLHAQHREIESLRRRNVQLINELRARRDLAPVAA